MINVGLLKRLKDAGYPELQWIPDEGLKLPSMSNIPLATLIRELGNDFYGLWRDSVGNWSCITKRVKGRITPNGMGKSPEEAAAILYVVLHENKPAFEEPSKNSPIDDETVFD